MKEDIVERFYKIVKRVIMDGTDEFTIEDTVRDMAQTIQYKNKLTNEQIEKVIKQLHAEVNVTLDLGSIIKDTAHIKWFDNRKAELDMYYWNRYKDYLSIEKNFSHVVTNKMDDILDTITDLVGDPTIEEFQRRGLIVGDVQSGKTANYTGLICKAADAKYKVIILLTGTIEELRKQTQERIDEGFVGTDSDRLINKLEGSVVGVGKVDNSRHPAVFSSKSYDFNIKTAKSANIHLSSLNEPIIFVIKKNTSVLKSLNSWLEINEYENKIDSPLLIIDDEADNASINTNKEENNPTAINKQIRILMKKFNKVSYVGFTATPFANIFINPESEDEMLSDDLFPKDFIYSLDAPSNYIGARNIFGECGKYNSSLKVINDLQHYFLESHKKDDNIIELPPSLLNSLNSFFIANVIRDLRDDKYSHRSMLINMSRFTDIQDEIGVLVNEYLKNVQKSINIYSKLSMKEALEDSYMKSLYDTFNNEFSSTEFSWIQIQEALKNAIIPIKLMVMHYKNKNKLDYNGYKENGLRIIVIGGFTLSRGLTLEGLVTSYFYRNSKTYDTLMQMGRWFGYRKNYEDLVRIWMTSDAIEWYEYISDSTDELRREIKRMENSNMTPLDFGLRVRNDIETLNITATNKMRSSGDFLINIKMNGQIFETPKIYNSIEKNSNNFESIKKFIKKLKDNGEENKFDLTNKKVIRDLSKEQICELLSDLDTAIVNIKFNKQSIIEFINSYSGDGLSKWDVAFPTGNGRTIVFEDIDINLVSRGFSIENNKIIKISGQRNRLGTPGDGALGLTDDQIDEYKKIAKINERSVSQKDYFSDNKRRPILLIYLLELNKDDSENNSIEKDKIRKQFSNIPLVGISIGIPTLYNGTLDNKDSNTKRISSDIYTKYKLNLVAIRQLENEDIEVEDE